MKAKHSQEYALVIEKYFLCVCHLQGIKYNSWSSSLNHFEVFSFHRPCSIWNLVRSGSSKSLFAFYRQS